MLELTLALVIVFVIGIGWIIRTIVTTWREREIDE